MNLKNVQNLISAPLKPNPSEWAMDVEEVLTDTNKLSEEAKTAIHKTKIHNGAFQNYTDELVAMLKRIVKKEIANKNNDVQGDDVVMTNKNVFIVYSHQNEYVMFKIKDFIERNLGLYPKTLDISEYSGSVWDAFSTNVADCQKAVVIMSGDDSVTDAHGNTYKQARPNVFIELGYFIHKCGLKNVTIVYSDDCKEPSDIGNLVSVHYGSEMWTENFRKQLNR